ncbi:MAG: YceI family protein [Balneolaceae bacterium]
MYLRILFLQIVTLVLLAGSAFAQEVTLALHQNSEMAIEGSSNVRSWGAEAESITGNLTLSSGTLELSNLTPEMFGDLTITVPVKSLESGTRGLSGNIHKYLKEKDHPNITFRLSDVTSIDQKNGYAEITARGTVNAAGKDNDITMTVRAEQEGDGLRISGTQNLLMTSFDIDPPRAMLGTIRADDEFSVNFNILFNN